MISIFSLSDIVVQAHRRRRQVAHESLEGNGVLQAVEHDGRVQTHQSGKSPSAPTTIPFVMAYKIQLVLRYNCYYSSCYYSNFITVLLNAMPAPKLTLLLL